MAKVFLVAVVILLFLAGFLLIMYSLFSSVSILPRLSNTTQNMDSDHYIPKNFRIGKVYFHEPLILGNKTHDPCNESKQIVILDILYNTGRLPDSCDVMVDDRFIKRFEPYDIPCNDCSEEVKLSIDIKAQTTNSDHDIELCCRQLCTKKQLKKIC